MPKATQNSGEAVHGTPDDVHQGLLTGHGVARGLAVKAQHPRSGIFGADVVPHQARPQPAHRPELGYFFKEVAMGVEKERDSRRHRIRVDAAHWLGELPHNWNYIGYDESNERRSKRRRD